MKKLTIKIVAMLMIIASTITGVTATENEQKEEKGVSSPRVALSLNVTPEPIKAKGEVVLEAGISASQESLTAGTTLIVTIPMKIVGVGSSFDYGIPSNTFDGNPEVTNDGTNYYVSFKGFKANEFSGAASIAVRWQAPLYHEGDPNIPTDIDFKAEFIDEATGVSLEQTTSSTYVPLGDAPLPIFAKWSVIPVLDVYDSTEVVDNVAQMVFAPDEAGLSSPSDEHDNIYQLVLNYKGENMGKTVLTDILPNNTSFTAPNKWHGIGWHDQTDKTIVQNIRIMKVTGYGADGWPNQWENVTNDFVSGNTYGNSLIVTNNNKLEVVFGNITQDDAYVVEYAAKIDTDQTQETYGVRYNTAIIESQHIGQTGDSFPMAIRNKYGHAIKFEKTTSPKDYKLGSEYINYTLKIENSKENGMKIPAGSKIVDPLITELTYVETDQSSYSTGHFSSAKTTVSNNTITWETEKEILEGETVEIKFKVKVDDKANAIDVGKKIANRAHLLRVGSPKLEVFCSTDIVGDGTININKTVKDSAGTTLDGAKFELIDKSNDTVFASGTTSKGGKLTFNNVPVGKYELKEVEAPNGYYLSDEVKEIVIDKDVILNKAGIVEIDFENEEITVGNLNVTKIDSDTGNPLAGAEFVLTKGGESAKEYYNDGSWVTDVKQAEVFVTDTNGQFSISELEQGKYTLEEVKAPEGYEIINKYTTVTVVKNEAINVVIKNKEITIGDLDVTKIDAETSAPLAGAEFILSKGQAPLKMYYSNGDWKLDKDEAEVFVTDANGKFSVKGLEEGEYTLEETKAPEGYEIIEEFTKVTIVKNDNVEITIKNKEIDTGNLTIVKVDEKDHKITLAGAEFILSKEEDSKILYYNNGTWTEDKTAASVLVTDKNGSCQIDDLPYGTYNVIEVKAPEGYELDENNSYTVTIKVAENIIEIENKKITVKPTTPKEPEDEGDVLGETHETVKDKNQKEKEVVKTSDNTNLVNLSIFMIMSGFVMFSFRKKKENC